MIGPTEDETARAFQYIGIAASLLSITKGCGEWWIRARDFDSEGPKDAPLSTTLQASLFFLPHVLFRTSALAFVGAYMGYFALGPIGLAVIIVVGVAVYSSFKNDAGGDHFVTLPLTIFAPTLIESGKASSRALMKRAITIFTSILLITLTCIRVAPTIIHQETLVSTYGLRHLNFMDPAGSTICIPSVENYTNIQISFFKTCFYICCHFRKLQSTLVRSQHLHQ